MKRGLTLALLLTLLPCVALAGLSRAALDSVGIRLPPAARLDMALSAPDSAGRMRGLREIAGGHPMFVTFVDYTCNALCGTDLALLVDAIHRAGLSSNDFRIIVIGIDPKDGRDAAARMENAEVPHALQSATAFLLPDKTTIAKATAALGFHYVYDPENDQFAHPAAVYALAPDGAVRTVLSPLALTAGDLQQALSGARPISVYERIRTLCYGYDPVTGTYTPRIALLLKVGAVMTVLAMGTAIAFIHARHA